MQAPAWQVSVRVQALPSLHVVTFAAGAQVPKDPATLHARHWPHDVAAGSGRLQHTPSTHAPDAHSAADVHGVPRLLGGCAGSATVTLNVALDELPSGSDAVQVTILVPIGNNVFGGGEQETLVPVKPVSIAVGGM